jgi:hypothetical protein
MGRCLDKHRVSGSPTVARGGTAAVVQLLGLAGPAGQLVPASESLFSCVRAGVHPRPHRPAISQLLQGRGSVMPRFGTEYALLR